MRKVLLIRSQLDPLAGSGTAAALWTLEALRDAYDLSLLTWRPVDLEALNRYYGTSLRSADVRVHQVPRWVRRWLKGNRLRLLQDSFLMRRCQRLGREYDILIGMNNEFDFGRRGIQYIEYPRFYDARVNARAARDIEPFALHWYHTPLLMRGYFWLSMATAGFSLQRMRSNLTLVNSDWTGRLMHAVHEVDTVTVYPPVRTDFPALPWERRENGFICVGRIAPEKRIETIIDILQAVRAQGSDVHLHIVGVPGPSDYVERIRRLQAAHAAWIRLEIDLPYDAVVRLLTTHRYGLHAMRHEPFGIALAEMVHAGCLLFVPADGGLVEIVGRHPDLVYETPAEAAAKIHAVIGDAAHQQAVMQHLAMHAPQYSTQRFMEQIGALVAGFSG